TVGVLFRLCPNRDTYATFQIPLFAYLLFCHFGQNVGMLVDIWNRLAKNASGYSGQDLDNPLQAVHLHSSILLLFELALTLIAREPLREVYPVKASEWRAPTLPCRYRMERENNRGSASYEQN